MDEFLHVRRLGAYLFFGVCAFCVSLIAGIIVAKLGASDLVQKAVTYAALLVVFMTLRDMTTQPRALEKEAGR
jgi:Na+-transporting methylmalonyl-CoA/oxaloacetate decarboxylase beta subunit